MKILIIEDDPSLREMLAITVAKRLDPKFELAKMEGLNHVLRYFVGTHTLLLAENLGEALRMVAEADGVLCDGTFPTAGNRKSEIGNRDGANERESSLAPTSDFLLPTSAFGGLRQNCWQVYGLAIKHHVPFVLLSGDDDLVTRAKLQGVAAFVKGGEGGTTAINWLFEAMGKKRESGVGAGLKPARTSELDQDATAA